MTPTEEWVVSEWKVTEAVLKAAYLEIGAVTDDDRKAYANRLHYEFFRLPQWEKGVLLEHSKGLELPSDAQEIKFKCDKIGCFTSAEALAIHAEEYARYMKEKTDGV